MLLYDSDQAGLRATFRAGDELLRHGVRVRVATMPPARIPTRWCAAGAPPALEPILGDAIDLLERKIQLLEQKGWFEGVDHQREALDRLLPTIRAAADPITRDLYLKEVSERTGVSRETLLQQVAARAEPVFGAASLRGGTEAARTRGGAGPADAASADGRLGPDGGRPARARTPPGRRRGA